MIFLGVINSAGSDVVNNSTTSSPFTIPSWVKGLRLVPSAATQLAAMKLPADAAFLPAATDMMPMATASGVFDLPAATDMMPMATASGVFDLPVSRAPDASPAMLYTLAVRKTDAGAGTTKRTDALERLSLAGALIDEVVRRRGGTSRRTKRKGKRT